MAISADLTAACNTTFRSGLKALYITEACNITASTADATSHAFTSITQSGDAFKLTGDSNTMSLSWTTNEKGAAEVTLTCGLEGFSKTTLHSIQSYINSRKLSLVAETNDSTGTYSRAYVVGYDSIIGANASVMATTEASIEADITEGQNMITITFTGKAAEMPRELVGTLDYNSTTVSFGS